MNLIPTSSNTDDTLPILSPLSSKEPDAPSPIEYIQLEHNFDDFINNQQQIHDTNISLTIQQPTHSVTTCESSTPSVYIAPTRAQRVFTKGKHPNTIPQFLISRPRSSRLYCLHPHHTNTPDCLFRNSPFSLNLPATILQMKTHIHHTSMNIPCSLHYTESPITTSFNH